MNVKHCDCLSWFSRKGESHKQDGETLAAQQSLLPNLSASGDPAMALGLSLIGTDPHGPPSFGSNAANT
jgi:hypothetical protein